jgi:hypothetical protein
MSLDHIRLREHQIAAVTCIRVGIDTRHVEYAGTTEGSETVGWLLGRHLAQLVWGSTEMIGDGCSDANGKVLVKCVGENLLPTAQTCGLWRPGLPIAAPCARNSHIGLLCHLIPGEALVTEL